MPDHRFRVGQMVAFVPVAASGSAPPDGRAYKIIQLLPAAWGGTRYRIKSVVEEDDRIVSEASLIDDTCIGPEVWDRMFARTAAAPHGRAPAASAPAPGTAPTDDIHVRRVSPQRWAIDAGSARPSLGTYRHRDCAEAYARALAHSRHVELIVHDASGGTVRHARAMLTYPTRLD